MEVKNSRKQLCYEAAPITSFDLLNENKISTTRSAEQWRSLQRKQALKLSMQNLGFLRIKFRSEILTNEDYYKLRIIKSNLSLYPLYYAKACNEFAGPISALLRQRYSATFEDMSQGWRAVGNIMSDLTFQKFNSQTFRFRDECVTVRPTGRFLRIISFAIFLHI